MNSFLVTVVLSHLAVVLSSKGFITYQPIHRRLADGSQVKNLIIDTDAGIDDGWAIFNFLAGDNINITAITTVMGNTNVDHVAQNVLNILKTADRLDIPVYKGLNRSTIITPPGDNFYGEDGFGDINFPDPPSGDLIQNEHAVIGLINLVKKYPGELTLVCLGPLSNIALAVLLYPDFLISLKEIYVLGGTVEGHGNIKYGVEFNFFFDPESAFIVFQEAERVSKMVTILPWDTCLKMLIDVDWRKNVLGMIDSPEVQLLNEAEANSLDEAAWNPSDAVLSALVMNPNISLKSNTYHAAVETCGDLSRGSVFVGYDYGKNNKTRFANIVQEVDVELFKSTLLTNFSPQASNGSPRIL